MSFRDATGHFPEPQKSRESIQLELSLWDRGEAPKRQRSEEALTAAHGNGHPGASNLMEVVASPHNLRIAMKRVRENKGSPGIDGMTVEELPQYWQGQGEEIRQKLLAGTYQPQPVRRQMIPKGGGGMRELGIPIVLDRFIQQAILQVLQPRIDPTFSEHSHGFRPGRRAHDAICEAQRYVQEGRRWVVDIDLEKFFDRVNHDVLMGRVCKRVGDKRILGLIRRYLKAGIMADGVVMDKAEGTPQGGPLSPLLANILLDDMDQELEKRGHKFVRYADDCNIYVGSKQAGQRVMELMRKLTDRLRLKINEGKSAVAPVWKRSFLGYSYWVTSEKGVFKRRVAKKSLQAMKERIREITGRNRGRNLEQVTKELKVYLRGWKEYFRLSETPRVFRRLDAWIRRRLRVVQLRQWRRGRTVFREMIKRGASPRVAAMAAARTHCWWRAGAGAIHMVLTEEYFDRMEIPRLEYGIK